MIRPVPLTIAVLALLGGCSTIFEGPEQVLHFNTNPPGATCQLTREDVALGNVRTPGDIRIKKTKHDIAVTCSRAGYEDRSFTLRSGVAGLTFANAVGGVMIGGLSWGVDSATGSDNKYQDTVNVYMRPLR